MAKKAWKEIYLFDYGDGKAMWNEELSVCCLVIPESSWGWGDDKPLDREAKALECYTDAIEWARIRLPEMYAEYIQWKEQQPDSIFTKLVKDG